LVKTKGTESVTVLSANGVSASTVIPNQNLWVVTVPVNAGNGERLLNLVIDGTTSTGSIFHRYFQTKIDVEQSRDVNGNGIPDEFDFEANGNGIPRVATSYFASDLKTRLDLLPPSHPSKVDALIRALVLNNRHIAAKDKRIVSNRVRQILQRSTSSTGESDRRRIIRVLYSAMHQSRSRKTNLFLGPLDGDSGVDLSGDTGTFNTPNVSLSSGSLTFSLPFPIAPTRSNLKPNLALRYSSDARQGPFGYGWGTTIASIERSTKHGVPHYTDADLFEYRNGDLAFDLVPTGVVGEFFAKINENYTRFVFSSNTWSMLTKEGTITIFGASANARMESGDLTGGRTAAWFIERVSDLHGNILRYSYAHDNNAIYPNMIDYDAYESSSSGDMRFPATYRICFLGKRNEALVPVAQGEPRHDVRISYARGFRVEERLRIAAIESQYLGPNGSASTLRRWELDYQDSADGTIPSLLTSIRVTGADGSRLPNVQFSYSLPTTAWDNSTDELPPNVALLGQGLDRGARFCDVNGDGYPDLILAPRVGPPLVFLNDTLGHWKQAPANVLPPGISLESQTYYSPFRIADINGDGKCDLIFARQTAVGVQRKFWINASTPAGGPKWVDAETIGWVIPDDIAFVDAAGRSTGTEIADLNGDGLPDFIQKIPGKSKVWIHNGRNGWTLSPQSVWNLPDGFNLVDSLGRSTGIVFADINGDGLADLIKSRQGSANVVLLNTGAGWLESPQYGFASSAYFVDSTDRDGGTRLVDFNGDGLPDLLLPANNTTTRTVLLNTGQSWLETKVDLPPNTQFIADNSLYGVVVNLHGGRLPDLYDKSNSKILRHRFVVPYVLTSMNNGAGALNKFDYSYSTLERVANTLANPELPYPKLVLKRMQHFDQISGEADSQGDPHDIDGDGFIRGYSTKQFVYQGGRFDSHEQDFLGFGTATVRQDSSEPSLPGITQTVTEFFQDPIRYAIPKKRTVYTASSKNSPLQPQHVEEFDWRIATSESTIQNDVTNGLLILVDRFLATVPFGTYMPYLAEQSIQEVDNGFARTTKTSYFYDEFGNQIIKHEYGDLDRPDDDRLQWSQYSKVTFGAKTWFEKTQTATYGRGKDAKWYLTTLNRFRYNAHGDQIQAEQLAFWPRDTGQSVSLVTTREFDAVGHVARETRPDNSTNTFTYDDSKRFLVESRNPQGQATKQSFDLVTGKLIRHETPNGVPVAYEYDGFGRMTLEHDDAGSTPAALDARDHIIRRLSYHYGGRQGQPNYVEIDIPGGNTDDGSFERHQHMFDGDGIAFGSKESWETAAGESLRSKREVRNSVGLIEQATLYSLGDEEKTTVGHIDSQYDGVGRLLERQYIYPKEPEANHTVQIEYTGPGSYIRRVQQSEEKWIETRVEKDTYDQEVKKTRIDQSNLIPSHLELVTTLSYDDQGHMLARSDTDGTGIKTADWLWGYDSCGHEVYAVDPDSGLSVQDLGPMGEVRARWNAVGQQLTAEYDAAGRITRRSFDDADGNTRNEEFTYDEGAHATGKLSKVKGDTFTITLSYDERGRESTRTYSLLGINGTLTRTFDLQGRLTGIRFPDNNEIQYLLSPLTGLPREVRVNGEAAISHIAFSSNGNLQQFQAGQILFQNQYSAADRLVSRTVLQGTTQRFSQTYGYDRLGNVTTVHRSGPTQNETSTFEYDQLNRLSRVNTSGVIAEYHFDPLGALSRISQLGRLFYDERQPHIPKKLSMLDGVDMSIVADAAGRIAMTGNHLYAWDATNNLSRVKVEGGPSYSIGYDHTGQRLYVADEQGPINLRFSEYSNRGRDGNWQDSIVIAGHRIGTVITAPLSPPSVALSIADQSSTVLADITNSGAILAERAYAPYGQLRFDRSAISSKLKRVFADYEALNGTRIYLSPSRPYYPDLGMFLSQDPVEHFGLSYAYGDWNPTNNIDINGLEGEGDFEGRDEDPEIGDTKEDSEEHDSEKGVDDKEASDADERVDANTSNAGDEGDEGDQGDTKVQNVAVFDPPIQTTLSPVDLLIGTAAFAVTKVMLGATGGAFDIGSTMFGGETGTIGGPSVGSSAEAPGFSSDPFTPPGPGFEWRGNGPVGSQEGSWHDPGTGESYHFDLNHEPPIGPHIDYRAPDGSDWRIFPDGTRLPK
jgi:RHS repeat-associated protein